MKQPDARMIFDEYYVGKDRKRVVRINYPENSLLPISVSFGNVTKDVAGVVCLNFTEYKINSSSAAQVFLKSIGLRYVDGTIKGIDDGAEQA